MTIRSFRPTVTQKISEALHIKNILVKQTVLLNHPRVPKETCNLWLLVPIIIKVQKLRQVGAFRKAAVNI